MVTELNILAGLLFYRRGLDRESVDKTFNDIHSFVNNYRKGKYILDQSFELRLMKLGVIV